MQKNKSSLEQADRPSKRNNPDQSSTFLTVLAHCILIIASPIVSFFVSKVFVFDILLEVNSVQSNIWSAVVAVVALHIALGLFLYRAYFETDNGPRTSRKED